MKKRVTCFLLAFAICLSFTAMPAEASLSGSPIMSPRQIVMDENRETLATITIDETCRLSVIFTPRNATNRKITWFTSDKSIATVSNGNVKGVRAGTVIITAQ